MPTLNNVRVDATLYFSMFQPLDIRVQIKGVNVFCEVKFAILDSTPYEFLIYTTGHEGFILHSIRTMSMKNSYFFLYSFEICAVPYVVAH